MSRNVNVSVKRRDTAYKVNIGRGCLSEIGRWICESLDRKPKRVAIVSNRRVFGIYGDAAIRSIRDAGIDPDVWLVGDGERFKNFSTLHKTLDHFGAIGLDRGDAVLAIGGGVVGDLAGFASAIYLRGIDLLQVPTTLLSMIDSSVGGKTGINTPFGKNLIGAFHQPLGVLIDIDFLSTLPSREITAGFCEAVKQGALSGSKLLNETSDILHAITGRPFSEFLSDERSSARFEPFLARQIGFKAAIVSGDERENTSKTDAKSRKILNFGHTFAHAIEKVTDYRYLKHGEAVGYGIVFAGELSKKLGLLSENELNFLNDVVHRAGVFPPIRDIDPAEVLVTFKHDKKVIGNTLQWILLKGIGNPKIISGNLIPPSVVRSVIKKVLTER